MPAKTRILQGDTADLRTEVDTVDVLWDGINRNIELFTNVCGSKAIH